MTPTPGYAPPAVTNPALCSLVDRRLGLDERVPPDITARLPIVRDAGDLAVLRALLADASEPDTVRHEVANLLFRSEFPGLDQVLLEVLDSPAEQARFRSWAVQHLGNLLLAGQYHGDRLRLRERLRQGLSDRHVEVRRESLLALTWARDEQARATARAWVAAEGAEADRLRDLAIRCARELDLRECIPSIRRYGHDPNEVIRLAALVALSEWGDAESRPAFADAAKASSVRLQSVGKAALARLGPPPAP